MPFYILLAVIGFASMIAASEMAKHRGLNRTTWFLYAALFGPLVLPVLYFRKSKA